MNNNTDFDFLNLNEIDPTVKPVPPGLYTLKVNKAEFGTFVLKQDDKYGDGKTGDTKKYVKFRFQVVGDSDERGKTMFISNFGGKRGATELRLLMDGIGIPQEGTLEDWLTTLSQEKPEFNAQVGTKPKKNDPSQEENMIYWRSITPVA